MYDYWNLTVLHMINYEIWLNSASGTNKTGHWKKSPLIVLNKFMHLQPTDRIRNYIDKVLKFKIDLDQGNLSLTKISEKTMKE